MQVLGPPLCPRNLLGRDGPSRLHRSYDRTSIARSADCCPLLRRPSESRTKTGRSSSLLFEMKFWASSPQALFFLPPLSDDTFSVRHIESDEFTSLLRYLLRDIPYIESLTSHSCKETVLAWMAKFGADKPTLYFLGRHVGTITSSDIYARGMQSRPLRKLAKREEGKCRRLAAAEGVHSPPLRSTGASATGDGAGEFCTQLAVTCGSIGVENDGSCSDIAPE